MTYIPLNHRKTFGTLLGADLVDILSISLDQPRNYLLEGWLFTRQISILAGPPNLGKTAIVACMAAHIARGENLRQLSVKPANIIYIAAEDAQGIVERSKPYLIEAEQEDIAFGLLDAAIDLSDPGMMDRLTTEMRNVRKGMPHEHSLVVIDTLNLSIGASDENVAGSMSQVIKSAKMIADQLDAHVVIVHHISAPSKSGGDARPRGSTVLEGNVDTVMMLEQSGDHVLLSARKQRSEAKPDPLHFRIEAFEIGEGQGGKRRTVPKAVLLDGAEYGLENSISGGRHAGGVKVSDDNQAKIREILRVVKNSLEAEVVPSKKQIRDGVTGPFQAYAGNADSLRKSVERTLTLMLKEGLLREDAKDRYSLGE